MTEVDIEKIRERYCDLLQPIFLPNDPVSNDIVQYFASLLRVVGMEDKGWDPYLESRGILEDLNSILQVNDSEHIFQDEDLAMWRMGLLMYCHIVEMDAPYEVITNLLRFQLGKGYSPNPFYMFLNSKERKQFKRFGLHPYQKIKIVKQLSDEIGIPVGSIFDEFYNSKLRNAITHSDYILTNNELRVRNGTGAVGAYSIPLEQLSETITKAKAFISAFLGLDNVARKVWGSKQKIAMAYDPYYKGMLEILVDDDELMCGFKVHWPNNSESTYRRTQEGVDMVNCILEIQKYRINFMVNTYAQKPGKFSPLVEVDGKPVYTPLEKTKERPQWPTNP